MSAYVVSPNHIKALALYATGYNHHGGPRIKPCYLDLPDDGKGRLDLANQYAEILYRENIRSVGARYPGDTIESMPGLTLKPITVNITPTDTQAPRLALSPVAILKLCDGLEYQSCETEDYRQTVAFKLLDSIRCHAICELPGYDEAKWALD